MTTARDRRLKALQEIESRTGRLTPESVVDAARDPEHPLHECFTWNNTDAAHAYRLDQARKLIASVRVVIETEKRTLSSVFYVRDPSMPVGEQGYVSLPRLRSDADLAREVLVQEFGRAAAALHRAHELAAALEIAEEVDAVLSRVRALRGFVEQSASAA